MKRKLRLWCRRHKRKAYVTMLVLTLVVAVVSVIVGSWLQSQEKPEQCAVAIVLDTASSNISAET
jgi:hypothetical protein